MSNARITMIPNGGRLIFLNQDLLIRHRYDLVCFDPRLIIGTNIESNDAIVGVLSHYKQLTPEFADSFTKTTS